MGNQYPLKIQNVGGDTYILISKGHHDINEFMRLAREKGYDWPLGTPQHVWLKATPDRFGDSVCLYSLVNEGCRGAFPATYACEAYGEEMYQVPAGDQYQGNAKR